MTDMDPAELARQWLIDKRSGTLCTLSVKDGVAGWPFGSVVPFALDRDGRPFILIANIAAHTANLRADPRGSLFVQQPEVDGDPQAGWRITLMGSWAEVAWDDAEELHARYLQRVPAADGYLGTHGFGYWRLEAIERVRYIGGFGRIRWLEGASVLRDPGGEGVGAAAEGAMAHMNADHRENMREMCRGLHGVDPAEARMEWLDRAGFTVRTEEPDRLLYFPFPSEIKAAEIRKAVVDVLIAARASG